MIELEFMTGHERHLPYPAYANAAGLTYRFTVLQENTFDERVPDTTFDEGVWRTLLAFIVGYDPSASVSVAELEKDIGREERPLSVYLDKWDAMDADDRDPPQMVILRAADNLRLCMLTEPYYLAGGPYPYGDACAYSLFSNRELGEEIMAFLRDRADVSRWRFAVKVLNAEDIPAPVQPRRTNGVLVIGLVFAAIAIYAMCRNIFG